MSGVFLSYAREDRNWAEPLVRALEAEGIDVWWDPEIDPGTEWDSVIKGQLAEAKCVIVLWSSNSTESYWVKTEAHNARDRGILVPVIIDEVTPPFGFELIQTEDLSAWTGDREAPNFLRIVAHVKGLLTGEVLPLPEATRRTRGWRPTNSALVTLLAGAAFGSLFAGTFSAGENNISTTVVGLGGLSLAAVRLFRPAPQSPTIDGGAPRAPFRFPLEQGFFGGLFGGAIAAPVISTAYYTVIEANRAFMQQQGWPVPTFWRVLTEITIASVLIACILGILGYGVAKFFEHFSRGRGPLGIVVNAVTGGIIGGALAGLITGPVAALYFGRLLWPVLEPVPLMLGAVPATGLMVFSIVSFDGDRLGFSTLRSLLIAIIATLVVAVVSYALTAAFQEEINQILTKYLVLPETRFQLVLAGLYYGGFVGLFLGAIVGITAALVGRYRGPIQEELG